MSKKKMITLLAVAGLVLALAPAAQADLIAHWKMDNDATDSAGSFNATPVGSPTYATGRIGQAILLNGIDQRADVAMGSSYPQASVSVWINTNDADAGGENAIFHHNDLYGSNPGTPHLALNAWGASANRGTIVFDYGGPLVKEFDSITQAQWHHVAWTYDKDAATPMRLYIDGGEVDTHNTSNGVLTLSNMGIGGVQASPFGDRYFQGMIDDLAVWDEMLSPGDISTIYNNGLQGIGVPEPATMSLLGFGAIGMLARRKRRN